jgi:hypothetical protein
MDDTGRMAGSIGDVPDSPGRYPRAGCPVGGTSSPARLKRPPLRQLPSSTPRGRPRTSSRAPTRHSRAGRSDSTRVLAKPTARGLPPVLIVRRERVTGRPCLVHAPTNSQCKRRTHRGDEADMHRVTRCGRRRRSISAQPAQGHAMQPQSESSPDGSRPRFVGRAGRRARPGRAGKCMPRLTATACLSGNLRRLCLAALLVASTLTVCAQDCDAAVPTARTTADFDGDGVMDLAVGMPRKTSSERMGRWRAQGTGGRSRF